MFDLIVVSPFGEYSQGQRIVDPKAVDAILASENAAHVVKVAKAADK